MIQRYRRWHRRRTLPLPRMRSNANSQHTCGHTAVGTRYAVIEGTN
jgi:hypothetical protein